VTLKHHAILTEDPTLQTDGFKILAGLSSHLNLGSVELKLSAITDLASLEYAMTDDTASYIGQGLHPQQSPEECYHQPVYVTVGHQPSQLQHLPSIRASYLQADTTITASDLKQLDDCMVKDDRL
jgi:hypothetical protein